MTDQEYQRQRLLCEYETLRTEILQCYEQQTRLVFGAAITAAAALLATLESSTIPLVLPALLTILVGVCNKSVANYKRIYRIGSYIAVVHEQQGKPPEAFRPGPNVAAWSSRWREASRGGLISPAGGTGARAEAWFLLLLGAAGWGLIGGSVAGQFFVNPTNIAAFSLSVVLSLILLYLWFQLTRVFRCSKRYEDSFGAC